MDRDAGGAGVLVIGLGYHQEAFYEPIWVYDICVDDEYVPKLQRWGPMYCHTKAWRV